MEPLPPWGTGLVSCYQGCKHVIKVIQSPSCSRLHDQVIGRRSYTQQLKVAGAHA